MKNDWLERAEKMIEVAPSASLPSIAMAAVHELRRIADALHGLSLDANGDSGITVYVRGGQIATKSGN